MGKLVGSRTSPECMTKHPFGTGILNIAKNPSTTPFRVTLPLCRSYGVCVTTIVCLTSFYTLGTVLAAEEKNPPAEQTTKSQNPFDISLTSGKGPINIRSGKLEFFYNEKRIVYRGDVIATRDNGTIKSDLLTVTYEEQEGNVPTPTPASTASPTNRRQRIKEAVAEGSVEITSANGNATCKKAVFNEIKRTVILNGDAVLRDGENVVKGQVVTVFLDENRVTVEGNAEQRPEMEIVPKQEEKKPKGGQAR